MSLRKIKNVFLCLMLIVIIFTAYDNNDNTHNKEIIKDSPNISYESDMEDNKSITSEGENKQDWEKGYDLAVETIEEECAYNDCKEIMEALSDLYDNIKNDNLLNKILPDKTINNIMERLISCGYSVTSNKTYSNMGNYRNFERFLKKAKSGTVSSSVIYIINSYGAIEREKYIFDGEDMYVLTANLSWDDGNIPDVTNLSYTRIKEWRYSNKGWFCYRVCVPEYPDVTEMADDSRLIRVKPMSIKKREASKKYVFGIGYQGNNLLCSNWDENNMKNLDYNGLYEYLYEMKHKKQFNPEKYPNGIPKKEFEGLIMEYLPVEAQDIQKYAEFNSKTNTYKWLRLGCFNYTLTHFGTSVPEVVDIRKNKDKTITLTVDAVCEMVLCDEAVITHELTIKKYKGGGFKYIKNKIINKGINDIPSYQYRITGKKASVKKDENFNFLGSIEEFINSYNNYYKSDKGIGYIKHYSEWYSYIQDFGRHKGDMHYEFTVDKKIWTLPTITAYTPKKDTVIKELTVNFDDHSYTDKMYKQYEEMCFYTLKVFFPDMDKKKIIKLYKTINNKAYKNIFQKKEGFHSNNPPSYLYVKDGIGVYPYFAYGESVRMCIIPVTKKIIQKYRKKGTVIRNITEK